METPENEKLKKQDYTGDASSRMDLKDDITAKENAKMVELQSHPIDHHNISRELAGRKFLNLDKDPEKGNAGSMRSIKSGKSNLKNHLSSQGQVDKSHQESQFGKIAANVNNQSAGAHNNKDSKSKLTVQSKLIAHISTKFRASISDSSNQSEYEQEHFRVIG
jgi:hypothetical protein